ncbi:ATP-binding cassette domain-containing protein, partial [Cumulibacter manganitolerans]|uniref:ATP-binding cassette domain-containing protein n=1 Tax=Cumulibacter manganitolerans TaxID=1884992 RepID=UPI0012949A51
RLASRGAARAGAAAGLSMLALAGGVLVILAVAAQAAASGAIAAENAAVVVMLPLGLIELGALIEPALATRLAVRASAVRLIEVLETPAPTDRGGVAAVRSADRVPSGATVPAPPWPVELTGAAIRWPGCEEPAVRGVDLRLEPGRPVALVGPSGSGKSTVVAALMGYAEVVAGEYRIGGRPATEIGADDVLALFGWCDQSAHLFDTSVAENLRLARPDATDGELRAVVERAQLGPWLRSLPKGLDTRVGAFGVLVSGGQRQRLALARALLADRPILLVDEPTAGLDREVADDLMRDILAESVGKALLVVTHDRSRLDGCTVLDLGRSAAAPRLDVASA